MAFHISNFGNFAKGLRSFKDIDGFVPEVGDKPGELNFGHDGFVNDFDSNGDGYEGAAEEAWDDFLRNAVQATEYASAAKADWV